MKKAKTKKSSWSADAWSNRCAWCAKEMAGDQKVFAIEISLRPEAFREFDPGSVQPLLLMQAGKTVPMMIVTEDSPAKHAGKDALFQTCSETCAQALQSALVTELSA